MPLTCSHHYNYFCVLNNFFRQPQIFVEIVKTEEPFQAKNLARDIKTRIFKGWLRFFPSKETYFFRGKRVLAPHRQRHCAPLCAVARRLLCGRGCWSRREADQQSESGKFLRLQFLILSPLRGRSYKQGTKWFKHPEFQRSYCFLTPFLVKGKNSKNFLHPTKSHLQHNVQ